MNAQRFLSNLRRAGVDFVDEAIEISEDIALPHRLIVKLAMDPCDFSKKRIFLLNQNDSVTPLSTLYKEYMGLLDYKQVENTFYAKKEKFSFQFKDYWLNKLFEVNEKSTGSSHEYKLIHLITRFMDKETIIRIFRYTRFCDGWIVVNPDTKEVRKFHENICVLPTLSILRQDGISRDQPIIHHTGVIIVGDFYNENSCILQTATILSDSPTRAEIEYLIVNYRTYQKYASRVKYTFSVIDGSIHSNKETLDTPDWFDLSQDKYDIVKHPHNKFMHHVLPDSAEPLFEGKYLYITCDMTFYVKLSDSWVPVAEDWLRQRIGLYKDIEKEWLAIKMMGIL